MIELSDNQEDLFLPQEVRKKDVGKSSCTSKRARGTALNEPSLHVTTLDPTMSDPDWIERFCSQDAP